MEEEFDVKPGSVNGLSVGDNGFYLFFADSTGRIVKHKQSSIGVTYQNKEDIHNFVENILKPAQRGAQNDQVVHRKDSKISF